MIRGILTIILLIFSNSFMVLAWYGQIMFKSKLEKYGLAVVVIFSWLIALLEYCFMVPANRVGSIAFNGPFTLWQLKVIQEVISLVVFTLIVHFAMRGEPIRWNHIVGFICLIFAVMFIFKK